MSNNPMQEKCVCGHPKHAHYFGDATMDTPCGVCSCQNFKFPAPALSDEEIREETAKLIHTYHWRIVTDKRGKDNLTPDILNGWLNELADQILSLTASHYTEKIKELEAFIKWLRDEEAISPEDWDKHCKEKWEGLESKYGGSK